MGYNDNISNYLNKFAKYPPCNATKNLELILKYRSAKTDREKRKAEEELIKGNARFILSIAKKYRDYGELEDRLQCGLMGFVRAIDKFDPDRGVTVLTYAGWWIKQSISRECQKTAGTIRIPAGKHEDLKILAIAITKMQARGEAITTEAIAQQLQWTCAKVQEIRAIGLLRQDKFISIHSRVGEKEDGCELIDTLADHKEDPYEREEILEYAEAIFEEAFPEPLDKSVFLNRKGLIDGRRRSPAVVACQHGITPEETREILLKSRRRLEKLAKRQHIKRQASEIFSG